MKGGWIAAILTFANDVGIDLSALALAWARALPAITLVPVFALRGLPAPLRAMLALLIAACVAPGMSTTNVDGPWPAQLVAEVLRGIPIGIAAAIPLYVLSMTGGIVDHLRGAQESLTAPYGDAKGGVASTLFSLIAAVLFFGTGGPAHLASSLLLAPAVPDLHGLLQLIVLGITFALTLATPLLAAGFVLDLTAALIAKAAQPAPIQPVTQPLKSAALMVFVALTLPYLLEAAVTAFAASS